jgi:hypothetical protein
LFGDIVPDRTARRPSARPVGAPRAAVQAAAYAAVADRRVEDGHPAYLLMMLSEYFQSDREALDFMREHASVTIVVPTAHVIEKMALDRQVVASLNKDPSPRTVSRLSSLHDVSKRQLSKTYRRGNGVGIAQRRRDEMHCRHPRLSRFTMRVRV